MKEFGLVAYERGKLCFTDEQWVLIVEVARRQRRSPHKVVLAALRRGMTLAEKAKDTRD